MPLLNHLQFLAFALLSALVLAYLLTPLAMQLGCKLGLVDMPGGRRVHEKPTPRSGGLAVFAAFFGTLLLLPSLGILPSFNPDFKPWIFSTLWVSFPVLVIGLVDDRWEVRPFVKLSGQIIAAVLAWQQGLQLESVLGMELHPLVDFAASVFIFLAAMNAYNLIDGMDGVAGGLGAVTGFGLCGLNLMLGNTEMAAACLALSGACLGFLRYNFHPARVFLGDTGSMLIGFLLIALTFGMQARSAAAIMLIVPLLTLGVPMVDTGLAIWRRSVRKAMAPGNGAKVSQGDRDHLHHRLARGGLTQRRVAGTLYMLQASIFAIGLLWVFLQNHRLAIFTAAFFVGSYVLLRYLASVELNDSGRLIVDGIRRPDGKKLYTSLMPVMDIAILGGAMVVLSILAGPEYPRLRMAPMFKDAAPTLIGGPLILLWATRYYRPQWTRARALDFFFVGIIATAGVMIGFSLSSIPYHHSMLFSIRIGILYVALSVPFMVTLRAFPRLVQDMVHLQDRRHGLDTPQNTPNVLIYGAGYGYTLLTRAESFEDSKSRRHYYLVGLLDDNPLLKGRHIHGHKVLGGLHEIPSLLRIHKITEIILTIQLPKELESCLMEIAGQFNLRVSQSIFYNRTLREPDNVAAPPTA